MLHCDWDQEPIGPIHFKIAKEAHGLGLESDKRFCSIKCKEQFIEAIIEADVAEDELSEGGTPTGLELWVP